MVTPAPLGRYVTFVWVAKCLCLAICSSVTVYLGSFLYTLFQCGQPMEISHCLDCGAVIGGNDHRPVAGFHIAQLQ